MAIVQRQAPCWMGHGQLQWLLEMDKTGWDRFWKIGSLGRSVQDCRVAEEPFRGRRGPRLPFRCQAVRSPPLARVLEAIQDLDPARGVVAGLRHGIPLARRADVRRLWPLAVGEAACRASCHGVRPGWPSRGAEGKAMLRARVWLCPGPGKSRSLALRTRLNFSVTELGMPNATIAMPNIWPRLVS